MPDTDYLLQAALGALEGVEKAYVPFQKAKFEDQLLANREKRTSDLELQSYRQKLPLEEASKIRIEKAKPIQPTYIVGADGTVGPKVEGRVSRTPVAKQTEDEKQTAKNKAKLDREKPKASGALRNTLSEYDNIINEAKAIKDDPDLDSSTGLIGSRNKVTEGGRRVSARIETLKSKTLLNVLSSLKQLSTTGASGFGQLSDKEGGAIQNSVSSLDKSLGTKDFRNSLDRFVLEMESKKDNLKRTYGDTYGEDYPEDSKGISAPSSIGGGSSLQDLINRHK